MSRIRASAINENLKKVLLPSGRQPLPGAAAASGPEQQKLLRADKRVPNTADMKRQILQNAGYTPTKLIDKLTAGKGVMDLVDRNPGKKTFVLTADGRNGDGSSKIPVSKQPTVLSVGSTAKVPDRTGQPRQPGAGGMPSLSANDFRLNIGRVQTNVNNMLPYETRVSNYTNAATRLNSISGKELYRLNDQKTKLTDSLSQVEDNIAEMEEFYRQNGYYEDQMAYDGQVAAKSSLQQKIADLDSNLGEVQAKFDTLEKNRPEGVAPLGLDQQMAINSQSNSGDAWKTQGIPQTTLKNAQSYRIAAEYANQTYGEQYGKAAYELREAKQKLEEYRNKLEEKGREGDNRLARLEAKAAQKQAAYDEVSAHFDEVDKLRPQGANGQTVRDSTNILLGYYQPPTLLDIPILGDVFDGAYQFVTQNPSLKSQMQRDKLEGNDGIGFLPAVGAGLVKGGNSFNDTLLGVGENALDFFWDNKLGRFVNPNFKNPFTSLREKNTELGQAAFGDALNNATGAEKVLINTVSNAVNSGAHMALGGIAGKAVGGAVGIGSSMQPITAMQQAKGAAAVGTANMSSFIASSMTDEYDQSEAEGDPPLKTAARVLTAGMASLIANSEPVEGFMKKMGLGIDVDDVLAAQYISGRMINNWGEGAMRWAEDTLTNQALAEGTQEVVELILDRSLDAGFTGNLLNPEFWEGFDDELKENFFYGYMGGALYSSMTLPSYAPSQQMLGQMINGEMETTPENIVQFIEQTSIDSRNPELQQEAQRDGIPDQMSAGDVQLPTVQAPEAETNVPAEQELVTEEDMQEQQSEELPPEAAGMPGGEEALSSAEQLPDMQMPEMEGVQDEAMPEAEEGQQQDGSMPEAEESQQQDGSMPEAEEGQQPYNSREEIGRRFRERAKPLVDQTRDLWQRIRQIEDPVTRTLKELAYEMQFRTMWEEEVNEQFYREYPHLRPDPEVENRKVQERLAQKPPVLLQVAYDMVREQPWYGAGQQWNGNTPVVPTVNQQSRQMPAVPESQQRSGQMPVAPVNLQQNGQTPVAPEGLQQNGQMPVAPQNWQVAAAQGNQQMPVPSQAETGGRFRALTAPPAGQTGTATASMFPGDPTSDAKSELPLVAYSATSRKNRKLAEKRAAKLAELENRPEQDVLPADAVSQQAEEADVDMRKERPDQSPVILDCIQQVKETGKCPEKLVVTAGAAFIEDMNVEAEEIEKQISQLTQIINKIDDEAHAALEEYGPQHPLVLESDRLVEIRYKLSNKLKRPELIKHTLSKYREIGYSTQKTSGTYAGELFDNRYDAGSEKIKEEACKKWVAEACDYFPTDWLNYGTDAGKMLVGRADRAFYNHYGDGQHSVLNLDSKQDDKATSFHEIVHRFEQVVPGLLAAEQAYYLSRTAGEAVVALKEFHEKYRSDEYTRPDHFADPYMGKDYAGATANAGSNRHSYELCSMGFQYLFTDISKFNGDTHMIQWLFGLLLLI